MDYVTIYAKRCSLQCRDAVPLVLQGLAKLLSRHVSSHSTRMDRVVDKLGHQNKSLAQDVSKLSISAQSACAETSNTAVRWAGEAKSTLASLLESHDGSIDKSLQVSIHA